MPGHLLLFVKGLLRGHYLLSAFSGYLRCPHSLVRGCLCLRVAETNGLFLLTGALTNFSCGAKLHSPLAK